MTTINVAWSFRGINLHGTNWNISMLSPSEVVPGRRGDNIVVPGLDGRIFRAKAMDQRVVSLAMFVKGTSGSALEADLETLKALLGQPGQGVLSRTVPGRTAWSINAEVANVVDWQPTSHLSYKAVIEFLCADPYWSGAQYEQIEGAAPGPITTSPHSWTIVNNGTAINERPLIYIGGDITNPKLTCGDFWLQYTGAVVAGNTLAINCLNFTAEYINANVVANITHGGGVPWMRFAPGNNTFTLEGTGLTDVIVTTRFTELWL